MVLIHLQQDPESKLGLLDCISPGTFTNTALRCSHWAAKAMGSCTPGSSLHSGLCGGPCISCLIIFSQPCVLHICNPKHSWAGSTSGIRSLWNSMFRGGKKAWDITGENKALGAQQVNSHTIGLGFWLVMKMLLSKWACGHCSRLGPEDSVLFRSRTREYEVSAFPGARLVRLSPQEPRRPAQSKLPSPNITWPNQEFVHWCQFLVCQQLLQINILEVRGPAEREKSISSAFGITFQNYRKKREGGKSVSWVRRKRFIHLVTTQDSGSLNQLLKHKSMTVVYIDSKVWIYKCCPF